ncbi:MAG: hypothetical protein KGN00_00125 [Chloroflexota bacterium]|nr:hypothetical protein [Chloroflexota bacterium]MDE3192068.1 hypothetical protein [Chloroflexota bacterium]
MSERSEIQGWLSGRIPADWDVTVSELQMDEHEVLATVRLKDAENVEGDLEAARSGRIQQFRSATRDERIRISQEAQRKFRKVVSWGAECGDSKQLFTHLALPVMTRLRLPEREVLDSLVEAGIARSRAHALAWCVALVREHQGEWLKELRQAMESVARVRAQGPRLN